MKLKVIFIFTSFIFFSFSLKSQTPGEITNLVKVLSTEEFSLSFKSNDIPKFIYKYISKEQGEKFNMRDKIRNSYSFDKSSRRLEYFAISEKYCVLHFEHLGRGNHHHALIFEISDRQAQNMVNLITPKHGRIDELCRLLLDGLTYESAYQEL